MGGLSIDPTATTCPTCGQRVEIASADEGTSGYVGVEAAHALAHMAKQVESLPLFPGVTSRVTATPSSVEAVRRFRDSILARGDMMAIPLMLEEEAELRRIDDSSLTSLPLPVRRLLATLDVERVRMATLEVALRDYMAHVSPNHPGADAAYECQSGVDRCWWHTFEAALVSRS